MTGYIYQITNKLNNKKYIGKTNDIDRRIKRHFSDLENNRHHSVELQRAFNKYGKDNFVVSYDIFENISEEELSKKEIQAIKYYDSYYNGYNETFGGEGHSILFDFETTVLIFQLGQRYDGIKHILAKYFSCDRTTITAIMNREKLKNEPYEEEKLQKMIKNIGLTEQNLKENYKNNYDKKLSEKQIFCILAEIEFNERTQASCGKACGVGKDIVQNIISGRTYKKEKSNYEILTKEERQKYLNILKIDSNAKKVSKQKITQEIVDYIMDNKDNKNQVQISQELGIDRKRVGRIIHKETYKDLVENWEKRHS